MQSSRQDTRVVVNTAELAAACARILDEAKMDDIRVLKVGSPLRITDYFVIASGRNPRHLKAAATRLFQFLRESDVSRFGVEGYRDGKWVLVDLVDVVVHLFEEESRAFYDLELLWGDCPRMDWTSNEEVQRFASADPHPEARRSKELRPAAGD